MQGPFLRRIAQGDGITEAAEALGICRSTHNKWLKEDPTYKARYDEAIDEKVDRLEAIADHRATVGRLRKRFHKDEPIIDPATGEQYVEYEPSDNLLMFRLKALRPEVYRESVTMIQATGISIQQVALDVGAMGQTVPPPGRAMLRQLVEESEKSAGSNGNGHAVATPPVT